MARAKTLAIPGLGEAGRAAAPWLALTAISLVQAWRHWRADFPFGTAGFCGHLSTPHCAWCVSAAMGVLATITVVAVEIARAPRAEASR